MAGGFQALHSDLYGLQVLPTPLNGVKLAVLSLSGGTSENDMETRLHSFELWSLRSCGSKAYTRIVLILSYYTYIYIYASSIYMRI